MAKAGEPYQYIDVESYLETATGGLHGAVHVRPVRGGPYATSIRVECPREMRDIHRYELGTRFRMRVKLTDREGGTPFLWSHHSWPYTVLPSRKGRRSV